MTAGARSADPGHVETAARRLREAGALLRARDRGDVLDALCAWLEGWRAADSPWRAELATALDRATGQHEATVHHGLELALAGWTADALRRTVATELGGFAEVRGFPLSGAVLAGAIPMPSLSTLLWPLVLQSPVLVKRASADPATPDLAVRTLSEIDPLLGRCIEVLDFGRDAEACHRVFADSVDCLVATGSDEAVAAWAARTRPPRRFVGFGHRLSIAVLGPAADLEAESRALALDAALWDQQGCLSPVAVYVVGPDSGGRARALAGLLGEALERAEARWPRGEMPADAAALAAHERAEAELRAASNPAVTLVSDPKARWCVVAEADAVPRPAPLHRFLRIHPVADPDALADALAPLAPVLAGVALAGFGQTTDALAARCAALGASRVCAPGTLQTPPLDWHHDGQPLLLPWARITDREKT